jgi:signal transduction histidine kinase
VREEFLSVASHELRTPITVLATQAQLSLRRLERDGQLSPERVAQALRTMGGQADKLARLVSQLLDISRLDGGKLTIEPELTDLVPLVDQLLAGARLISDNHTISLIAPESLTCMVDGLRLEQVISNMLDNAIKYSPGGGPIEVVLRQADDQSVGLSVRDHGLGVPPEKRERIFERFYQAHQNGYRHGMGLGLYVSRHIVELHGGDIQAEFPADGGTQFVVRLPVA